MFWRRSGRNTQREPAPSSATTKRPVSNAAPAEGNDEPTAFVNWSEAEGGKEREAPEAKARLPWPARDRGTETFGPDAGKVGRSVDAGNEMDDERTRLFSRGSAARTASAEDAVRFPDGGSTDQSLSRRTPSLDG